MADYHPLIARAVVGLEKNTGDARRGLYERARSALVAQLRGVKPVLSESDITRERLALEEAIRKVEAESVRAARAETSRPDPVGKAPSPELLLSEALDVELPPPPPPPAPPPPRGPAPQRGAPPARSDAMARRPVALARQGNAVAAASMLGEQRYVDPVFDQPLPADLDPPEAAQSPTVAPPPRSPPAAAPRPAPRARPRAEQRSLLDAGLNDFRNVVAETNELGEASAWAAKSARDNYGDDTLAETQAPPAEQLMLEPQTSHPSLQDLAPADFRDGPYADEEAHPAASRGMHGDEDSLEDEDASTPRRSYWPLLRLAAAAVIVVGITGLAIWLWPTVDALYRVARGPSSDPTTQEGSPTAKPKISDRIEPGGQQNQPTQLTAVSPTATPGGGAAVAQRVVLYEEDPTDPNGKRFVGSAIWRTETITPGPGQSPDVAIRADVEIPERKLAMTWSLRRNTDPGLPASHTVEIMFKLPADFTSGGVSNVPGILMKASEQTRGVPLAGLAVKVTNGFFLIGLSAADADRERNLQLLKERAWFDIPVVYNNNRRAILALEKGTPGERAFADAFAAWRQ